MFLQRRGRERTMIVKEVRSNLKSGRIDLNVFGLDRKGIVRG